MRKITILFVLLIYSNLVNAQCVMDFLYDSLSYTNDICKKTLIVKYLSYGKNPINGDTNNETHKIEEQIKYIPHSSVSFLYKGEKYNISISNECDISKYSKGDSIMIDILFFKNIKQPYKYKNPFSLVSSVTEYKPSKEPE